MKNKFKAIGALLLMATSLFLMIEINGTSAVGDSVLNAVGISPWTGEHTGTHMTVIYFGVIFFVSLPLVRIFFMERYKKSLSHVLVILAVLITIMTQVTEYTVEIIKSQSDGVYSIEFLQGDNYFEYAYEEGELVDLVVLFTLENHSQEDREFKVSLDSNWMRDERDAYIRLLDKEGVPASFFLYGKQKETFAVTIKNYDLSDNKIYNGNGGGDISRLIIEDENQRILLSDKNFFGLELVR